MQRLPEIARLTRQPVLARDVEQTRDADCRVHQKTRESGARGVGTDLQKVMDEHARFGQVVEEVAQPIPHELRKNRSIGFGDRLDHLPVHGHVIAEHGAIERLERVIGFGVAARRNRGAAGQRGEQTERRDAAAATETARCHAKPPTEAMAGTGGCALRSVACSGSRSHG